MSYEVVCIFLQRDYCLSSEMKYPTRTWLNPGHMPWSFPTVIFNINIITVFFQAKPKTIFIVSIRMNPTVKFLCTSHLKHPPPPPIGGCLWQTGVFNSCSLDLGTSVVGECTFFHGLAIQCTGLVGISLLE